MNDALEAFEFTVKPLRVHEENHLSNGNGEIKIGALSDGALDPDASAVGLDDVFGDAQAQPRPADFTRTRRIHAVKAFEDALLIGPWNSNACVRNAEDDAVVLGAGANRDSSSVRGVLNGVVEEILQHFGQAPAVAERPGQVAGTFDAESEFFLLGTKPRRIEASGNQLGNGHGSEVQFHALRFDLRKLQQVIGQTGEPARVAEDDL